MGFRFNETSTNIVSSRVSIRTSLKIMESATIKTLCVVDELGQLIGCLTDGDIRRALLCRTSLDDSIIVATNKSPKTLSVEDVPRFLSERNKELCDLIPVVFGSQLAGVLERQTIVEPINSTTLIMAGGFGTRLKPMTDSCPKPMLNVNGVPILERIIRHLKACGLQKFVVSVHYLGNMIKAHFGDGTAFDCEIEYLEETSPLGTGGAVSLLDKEHVSYPLVVCNGDVLTNLNFSDLLTRHLEAGNEATVVARSYVHMVPFGVIKSSGNQIVGIEEKPEIERLVNAGIYVINESIVDQAKYNEHEDLPNLLSRTAVGARKAGIFTFDGYWADLGRPDDLYRAEREVAAVFGS